MDSLYIHYIESYQKVVKVKTIIRGAHILFLVHIWLILKDYNTDNPF